jgi:8-oxo-dGTP diphosphatase
MAWLAGNDSRRFNAMIRSIELGSFHMSPHQEIVKIGLAVTDENRLLLVRKRGGASYILPGGKPEHGENDYQALVREVEEELGCGIDIDSLVFLGSFSDSAADMQNTTVTVRLYAARLTGSPSPQSEIERLEWFRPNLDNDLSLAPSLQNHIVPFLCLQGRL